MLPADLKSYPSRESAERLLGAVLRALPDDGLELSVHHHVDDPELMTELARQSREYVLERLTAENSRRRWWQLKKSSFPSMYSASEADLGAFCGLAFWTISADVCTARWSPMTVFESIDAGEHAQYTLPREIYAALRSQLGDQDVPTLWQGV